jgi:hypothetical protein
MILRDAVNDPVHRRLAPDLDARSPFQRQMDDCLALIADPLNFRSAHLFDAPNAYEEPFEMTSTMPLPILKPASSTPPPMCRTDHEESSFDFNA